MPTDNFSASAKERRIEIIVQKLKKPIINVNFTDLILIAIRRQPSFANERFLKGKAATPSHQSGNGDTTPTVL